MRFVSTRNRELYLEGHQAVVQGLSKDGGLFVPEEVNIQIDVSSLLNLNYQEIAFQILKQFLTDYTDEEIMACVNHAYDEKFDHEKIVPLTKTNQGYLMELWHGPTSAFKDIALTILPHLLTTAYQKENLSDTISILTATSGDTGKAALSGFADVDHTAITVFYPEDGVSKIQKAQMQTAKGNNVKVIAVKGNFDDCQRMVKQAYQDEKVKNACQHVTISSANSINIGRLLPQIVYYFSSYVELVNQNEIKLGDKVNFVVPTGNFGNILAGYIAKTIGLPVNKLICASNQNHVLTDFLKTGTYSTHRDFEMTISPSMDILISSNLERLLYFASNGSTELVAHCMTDLNQNGQYTIPEDLLLTIQNDFDAYWASEEECKATIQKLFEQENKLIDTHTAVAYKAMEDYQAQTKDTTPCIVLSTASPFKFSKSVLSCITNDVAEDDFDAMNQLASISHLEVPKGLAELSSLPIRFTQVIDAKDGIETIAQRMKELSHD